VATTSRWRPPSDRRSAPSRDRRPPRTQTGLGAHRPRPRGGDPRRLWLRRGPWQGERHREGPRARVVRDQQRRRRQHQLQPGRHKCAGRRRGQGIPYTGGTADDLTMPANRKRIVTRREVELAKAQRTVNGLKPEGAFDKSLVWAARSDLRGLKAAIVFDLTNAPDNAHAPAAPEVTPNHLATASRGPRRTSPRPSTHASSRPTSRDARQLTGAEKLGAMRETSSSSPWATPVGINGHTGHAASVTMVPVALDLHELRALHHFLPERWGRARRPLGSGRRSGRGLWGRPGHPSLRQALDLRARDDSGPAEAPGPARLPPVHQLRHRFQPQGFRGARSASAG
jgi:hypothetical protein